MNEYENFTFPMWTNIITVAENGKFNIGPYEYQVRMVAQKWPTPNDVERELNNMVDVAAPYAIICDDGFMQGKAVTVINGEAKFISRDAYASYYDLDVNDVLAVAHANHKVSVKG